MFTAADMAEAKAEAKAEIKSLLKKHNIKIESLEECAKSDYHVCASHRVMETDGKAPCCDCGKTLYFHDKFPKDGPQPKKICFECVVLRAKGEDSFDA